MSHGKHVHADRGMADKTIAAAFDLKALNQDGTFEGFASMFGELDQGGDIVAAGAFTQSLRERPAPKVKMLWQHDRTQPIGVWQAIEEQSKGLYVKGKFITAVERAKEAYALLQEQALDGLSIGYRTRDSSFDETTGVRTLKAVDLLEISVVTFPMLESATVTDVRGNGIATVREFETFLRDEGGFSTQAAKAIASGGFKSWKHPRDEGGEQDVLAALSKLREAIKS